MLLALWQAQGLSTALGSLCQCLTTLLVKKLFLTPSLGFLCSAPDFVLCIEPLQKQEYL